MRQAADLQLLFAKSGFRAERLPDWHALVGGFGPGVPDVGSVAGELVMAQPVGARDGPG